MAKASTANPSVLLPRIVTEANFVTVKSLLWGTTTSAFAVGAMALVLANTGIRIVLGGALGMGREATLANVVAALFLRSHGMLASPGRTIYHWSASSLEEVTMVICRLY